MKEAVNQAVTALPLTNAVAAYKLKVTDYVTKYNTYRGLKDKEDFAKLLMTDKETVYKDATTAKDTDEKKDDKSKTYFVNSGKALANAKKDCDDTAALITAKTAEVARLKNT